MGVAELLDTSEGGAVMSRCGFRSVSYLEEKIRCKNALVVSAVRSLEVVASRRLPMYSRTPLKRTPLGPGILFVIAGCP